MLALARALMAAAIVLAAFAPTSRAAACDVSIIDDAEVELVNCSVPAMRFTLTSESFLSLKVVDSSVSAFFISRATTVTISVTNCVFTSQSSHTSFRFENAQSGTTVRLHASVFDCVNPLLRFFSGVAAGSVAVSLVSITATASNSVISVKSLNAGSLLSLFCDSCNLAASSGAIVHVDSTFGNGSVSGSFAGSTLRTANSHAFNFASNGDATNVTSLVFSDTVISAGGLATNCVAAGNLDDTRLSFVRTNATCLHLVSASSANGINRLTLQVLGSAALRVSGVLFSTSSIRNSTLDLSCNTFAIENAFLLSATSISDVSVTLARSNSSGPVASVTSSVSNLQVTFRSAPVPSSVIAGATFVAGCGITASCATNASGHAIVDASQLQNVFSVMAINVARCIAACPPESLTATRTLSDSATHSIEIATPSSTASLGLVTPSATAKDSPSASASFRESTSVPATASVSPRATASATPRATASPVATATRSIVASPSATSSPSRVASLTSSWTASLVPSPSATHTHSALSPTASSLRSTSALLSPSPSGQASASATPSGSPSRTRTRRTASASASRVFDSRSLSASPQPSATETPCDEDILPPTTPLPLFEAWLDAGNISSSGFNQTTARLVANASGAGLRTSVWRVLQLLSQRPPQRGETRLFATAALRASPLGFGAFTAAVGISAVSTSSDALAAGAALWVVLTMAPLPSYAIVGDETVDIVLPRQQLRHCNVSGAGPLVAFARVVVRAPPPPPAAISASIVATATAGALASVVSGGMSSDTQSLAAVALMPCASPFLSASVGSYRSLAPLALDDSLSGVIFGNAIAVAAVAAASALVAVVLHATGRDTAAARFPGVALMALFGTYQGTTFAASLLSTGEPYARSGGEQALGVIVIVAALGALPVALVVARTQVPCRYHPFHFDSNDDGSSTNELVAVLDSTPPPTPTPTTTTTSTTTGQLWFAQRPLTLLLPSGVVRPERVTMTYLGFAGNYRFPNAALPVLVPLLSPMLLAVSNLLSPLLVVGTAAATTMAVAANATSTSAPPPLLVQTPSRESAVGCAVMFAITAFIHFGAAVAMLLARPLRWPLSNVLGAAGLAVTGALLGSQVAGGVAIASPAVVLRLASSFASLQALLCGARVGLAVVHFLVTARLLIRFPLRAQPLWSIKRVNFRKACARRIDAIRAFPGRPKPPPLPPSPSLSPPLLLPDLLDVDDDGDGDGGGEPRAEDAMKKMDNPLLQVTARRPRATSHSSIDAALAALPPVLQPTRLLTELSTTSSESGTDANGDSFVSRDSASARQAAAAPAGTTHRRRRRRSVKSETSAQRLRRKSLALTDRQSMLLGGASAAAAPVASDLAVRGAGGHSMSDDGVPAAAATELTVLGEAMASVDMRARERRRQQQQQQRRPRQHANQSANGAGFNDFLASL